MGFRWRFSLKQRHCCETRHALSYYENRNFDKAEAIFREAGADGELREGGTFVGKNPWKNDGNTMEQVGNTMEKTHETMETYGKTVRKKTEKASWRSPNEDGRDDCLWIISSNWLPAAFFWPAAPQCGKGEFADGSALWHLRQTLGGHEKTRQLLPATGLGAWWWEQRLMLCHSGPACWDLAEGEEFACLMVAVVPSGNLT